MKSCAPDYVKSVAGSIMKTAKAKKARPGSAPSAQSLKLKGLMK